nr:hypothetical protein [Tanacetum cinerariifolium]
MATKGNLGEVLPHARGLGFKPCRRGFPSGVKKEWGLSLKAKIFEQVRINLDIPVKAVQDQLQRELEVQIFMSKAFRAKAKAEREIRGDHVLQYYMLKDYVVELESTNLNTTVKIAVERNTDPFLPTRVFQRIYICLGAFKLAVGLDSNNGIYSLAYALVEAESKSSWCWFLQCLGDDIDLHPNSNFTFISDRKKGWCGQAYKDLLWRVASATNVRDFEKCMLGLKAMNPKAHEWLNKIPAEHWAMSYFSGILCEHAVEAYWNIYLNDRGAPPLKTWVNPCYWLSTWKKTYSHKIQPIYGTKYWEKSTYPTTLLPPKHHVQVGRPRKKRKRSKHEDELFVKDEPAVGHDGSVGSGVVIGLSAAIGEGGAGVAGQVGHDGSVGSGVVIGLSAAIGEGGAGVASQGSSRSRWTKRRVQTKRISPQKITPTQLASQPSTSSQVPVSETRNPDGREIGDGVPTQSSTAGGASKCPVFLEGTPARGTYSLQPGVLGGDTHDGYTWFSLLPECSWR